MNTLWKLTRYPTAQLECQLALATSIMLLYAGSELVKHSQRLAWLPDYTGHAPRDSATQAAFGAILAGTLLLNNLLAGPQEGRPEKPSPCQRRG